MKHTPDRVSSLEDTSVALWKDRYTKLKEIIRKLRGESKENGGGGWCHCEYCCDARRTITKAEGLK